MKSVKFNKKLVLNKKTIVDLNDKEMNSANGGTGQTIWLTNCGYCTVPEWCSVAMCTDEDCVTVRC